MDSGPYFEAPQKPASRRKSWLGWTTVVLISVAGLLAGYLQSPYVIERPGPVFNVLGTDGKTPIIQVVDAKSYPTDGALDLLTVNVTGSPNETPSWLEVLGAWLDPSQAVTPVGDIFPPHTNGGQVEKQNALMMQDSQSQATAAALRALGYRYSYTVFVDSVDTRAPAFGKIFAGDTITSVDGTKVTGIDGLRAAVNAQKGQRVTVAGTRDGKPFATTIKPKHINNIWRLGVYVGTNFKFPVKVQLNLASVGGPSGGMMFALGIYDKMTPGSLTGGQLIAGTGTIDELGKVGPIGGIRQKLYGAQRGGAKWFLAPATNCGEVVGHVPAGLNVVSVSNFSQALKAVKQIATHQNTDGLATCSK